MRRFKFAFFKMRVSVGKICKFDFKFERNNDKAKYFEMIFGVAQIKFSVG